MVGLVKWYLLFAHFLVTHHLSHFTTQRIKRDWEDLVAAAQRKFSVLSSSCHEITSGLNSSYRHQWVWRTFRHWVIRVNIDLENPKQFVAYNSAWQRWFKIMDSNQHGNLLNLFRPVLPCYTVCTWHSLSLCTRTFWWFPRLTFHDEAQLKTLVYLNQFSII